MGLHNIVIGSGNNVIRMHRDGSAGRYEPLYLFNPNIKRAQWHTCFFILVIVDCKIAKGAFYGTSPSKFVAYERESTDLHFM